MQENNQFLPWQLILERHSIFYLSVFAFPKQIKRYLLSEQTLN